MGSIRAARHGRTFTRPPSLIPIALGLLLLAGWPGMAAAVHTDVLELDGNTVPVTLDDWDEVYLGTDTALTSTFLTDLQTPSPPGDVTTFATGAQDPHPISTGSSAWQCNSDNNPQAQTNLQEAYAALYKFGSDYELFFGANREKVEGTFTMGWWFFQDQVSCTAPPTGAATFTGKKRHGDLLIIADFATGGDTPTGFKAYMWTDPTPLAPESGDECLGDGTDCTAAHSGEDHPAILGGNCQVPTDPNSILCGTVNTATINAAWRSGLGANRFWEAGIDLSQTVFADRCYLTFMAETRSSAVLLTASLKDFVLGQFNTCARILITKETIGGNATFDFDVTQGTLTPDPFSLDGGQSQEFLSVLPGTYVITEQALGGWSLTDLQCTATGTGTTVQKDQASGTVTITVEAGGNVECTFTNTSATPAGPDVKITKSDNPDPVYANGILTYTVVVENISGVAANNVLVTDTLPAGTAFVSCTPPPATTCSESAGVVTADLGTIPAGESRTITIVVSAPPPGGLCPGTLLNHAEVTATDDSNSTNNEDDEETQCLVASATITVDKVTIPSGDPTLFDFTITTGQTSVDSFSLADQDPAHSTSVAAPGSYVVTELPEVDWVLTEVVCTGGPFGSAGAVYTGTPFTVSPDDHVTCTFTNRMVRPGPPDFCDKSPVTSLLNPAGARFHGNLGLDHLVVLKNGESIQAALDSINDENNDGYVLIGVIYDDATGAWGGHTTQHFEINRAYSRPFALIGCSVTVHDDDLGNDLPTARITPAASNPLTSPSSGTYQHANILVMDVHGADSEVAGWLVEGDRRELRTVQASGNPVGVQLAGNNNRLVNGAASGNLDVGVLISGAGNYVDTYQAHSNGQNGFRVTGASNTIYRGAAGDKSKPNGSDGIFLSGSSANVVRESTAYANGGAGIRAEGARHQVLKSIAGDVGKGNADDGIHAAGTGLLLQENRARVNRGDGIDVQGGTAAAPNRLRSNLSNTGTSGGGAENAGAEYRLLGTVNNAGGGNKADAILVPKLTAPTKCTGFPAANTTKTFAGPYICE